MRPTKPGNQDLLPLALRAFKAHRKIKKMEWEEKMNSPALNKGLIAISNDIQFTVSIMAMLLLLGIMTVSASVENLREQIIQQNQCVQSEQLKKSEYDYKESSKDPFAVLEVNRYKGSVPLRESFSD